MGMKRDIILKTSILVFLSLLLPAMVFSEDKPVDGAKTVITSQYLDYDENNSVYHLKGDVEIRKGDAWIKADRVDYYEKTDLAVAEGNVYYEDRDVRIESEKAGVYLGKKQGKIFKARVLFKKDNYNITAEEIERIDEKNYILHRVNFTTCDTPFEAWCFSSTKADVRVGDAIRASNVTFRIKGLPAFYLPYLWAPINTERKTGLLMPDFGYKSDKGIFWRQPFFLVLSENRDITFYLDYIARRGIGEGVEYRYVERGIGKGRLWLYQMKDKVLDVRFFETVAEHKLFNRDGISGTLFLNLVNNKRYYREYGQEIEIWASRYLESKAELYYPLNNRGRFYIEGRFWQELSLNHETGEIAQKLPEIGVSIYPRKKGPFYFTFNSAFNNYYSVDLYRVKRIDIFPRIYHNFGNAVQISQALGLREVFYSISHSDTYNDRISRASFDYSLRAHLRLTRQYSSFRHVLEPEIGYQFIPEIKDEPPLLDSTELYDRKSEAYAGLRSYIFTDQGLLLSLRLSETYDFNQGDRPMGLVRFEGTLFRPFTIKIDSSYNPNSGNMEKINYSVNFAVKGISTSITQRYSKEDKILNYSASVSIPITNKWSIGSSIYYDAKGEGMRSLVNSLTYNSRCWRFKVSYTKRPYDYQIMFLIELKGIGVLNIGGLGFLQSQGG